MPNILFRQLCTAPVVIAPETRPRYKLLANYPKNKDADTAQFPLQVLEIPSCVAAQETQDFYLNSRFNAHRKSFSCLPQSNMILFKHFKNFMHQNN